MLLANDLDELLEVTCRHADVDIIIPGDKALVPNSSDARSCKTEVCEALPVTDTSYVLEDFQLALLHMAKGFRIIFSHRTPEAWYRLRRMTLERLEVTHEVALVLEGSGGRPAQVVTGTYGAAHLNEGGTRLGLCLP